MEYDKDLVSNGFDDPLKIISIYIMHMLPNSPDNWGMITQCDIMSL